MPDPAIVKEEKNERARHESVEKRTSHESEHFRIRHVQTAELNNDSSPTDKACTILIDPHALQRTKQPKHLPAHVDLGAVRTSPSSTG